MNTWESGKKMKAMLRVLEKQRGNRGLMANLKAGLRETKEHRAWNFLTLFCDPNHAGTFEVFRTIAGLFAAYPPDKMEEENREQSTDTAREAQKGSNMGYTCRLLCRDDEEKNLSVNLEGIQSGVPEELVAADPFRDGPMARRLKFLLDADPHDIREICFRVIRIVLYAKSKKITVNYETLGYDLLQWNAEEADKVRRRWARAFWRGKS